MSRCSVLVVVYLVVYHAVVRSVIFLVAWLDMIHEDVHGFLCGISRASGVAFDTAAEAFVDWRGDEER